jgi:hypothetical protein
MAKKLDLKRVFLERGEMIGLGVAVVIGLLLLVKSLFLPGRGLFSPGASEKVKALKGPTEVAERKLRDPENKPSKPEEIAPSDQEAKAKLIKPNLDQLASAEFRGAPLGHDVGGQGLVRSMPVVLNILEASAKAEAVPLQSYILEVVGGQLYVNVLRGEGESAKGPAEGSSQSKSSQRFQKMMGGPGGPGGRGKGGGGSMYGMGGAPGMGAPGLGRPGQVSPQGDSKIKGKKVAQVLVEKLGNEVLAEQVRPVRMAVIAASFPYKKQVEEFQKKLRKADTNDVLAENSADPSGPAQASFRFLGVRVQRRQVDVDG